MEAIRTALKIDKWNVYGVSYGTTVSLAYLQAHPERIHAAVLDSVYPPEMPGFSSGAEDIARSLELMNAVCAAQPRCKARLGDVRSAMNQAVASLDRAPLALPPRNEFGKPVRISGATLLSVMQTQLGDASSWYVLPLAIDQARRRAPTQLLTRLHEDAFVEASVGVWYATECRERAPFDHGRGDPRAKNRWPALAGAMGADLLFSLCDMWPAKRASNWETPRDVNVPTLVVAGEWDPVTPPSHARWTAERLGRRAQFLLVPNAAHGPSSSDACVEGIAAEFVDAPDKRIDASCAALRRPPVFATALVDASVAKLSRPLVVVSAQELLWLSLFVSLGLLSAALWPLGRMQSALSRTTSVSDPFWSRSSFWLSASVLSLVVWAGSFFHASGTAGSNNWWRYGIPIDAWAGSSLIVAAIALATLGTVQVLVEMGRHRGAVWVFHRLWVIVSLGLLFGWLWSAELLPRAADEVFDDAERLFACARWRPPTGNAASPSRWIRNPARQGGDGRRTPTKPPPSAWRSTTAAPSQAPIAPRTANSPLRRAR